MDLRAWWTGLSRAYQNAFALFVADSVFLLGMLLHIRPLQAAWEAVTGYLPNIYDGIVMQLVAVIRDFSPGSVVASSVTIDISTMFFSLLSMHVIVGFGLGFLFDHTERTRLWTFVNYFTMILVLFVIHFFLIIAAYL